MLIPRGVRSRAESFFKATGRAVGCDEVAKLTDVEVVAVTHLLDDVHAETVAPRTTGRTETPEATS